MLDRLNGGHVVALVVRGASGEKEAVANLRLERRRLPLVYGVGRLNVVVAVHREVWLAGSTIPIGNHYGQAALHDVDDLRLEAKTLEAVAQPLRVAQAVFAALGQGADRRYAKFLYQVLQVVVAPGCGPRERTCFH